MNRYDVPVLIVGAGPAGLTAGLLLQRLGIAHRIVERRAGPQRAPAAHCVNARTFEIFRQVGVDMNAIAAACQNPADAGFVYWVTKIGGEVIGRLPYEQQGDEVLDVTPTPLRNLSQHRLEPILVDSLRRAGAPAPFYSHEWESAEQPGDAVHSRIRDLESGETYAVRSRYLLAADGAASRVRKWVGITPIGPERIQAFVMIHFAASLRALVQDCPGVLYWICAPDAGGALVAHDIDREWVYMQPWDPDRESRDEYTEQRCEQIVRRAFVRNDFDLTIRTISTWMMTAQVAERYRAGRVFLVGDSAHRFPPTGGLGLNTGVQDAHNLVWKLAAVDSRRAGTPLLDTYEIERRPVAQNNADQSIKNAFRLFEVPQALGLSEDREASQVRMKAALADPTQRRRVVAAINDQAEHFDMLGLQLGFAYEAGALVGDGSEPRVAANPVRQFIPSARPGARLPHGWVALQGRRVSTLDLIVPDGFTLLVGPQGGEWIEAAGAELRCLQMGRDVADPAGWWVSVAEMGPRGALLVRPDQHVAYRARDAVAGTREVLAQTMAKVLHRGDLSR